MSEYDYALESQSTTAIAKALASAQKEIKPPKKSHTAKVASRTGASYEYKYASLDDLIECLKEPFGKHGLSHSQPMRTINGHTEIVTIIRHESGEWLRSYYPLTHCERPQDTGSAISYGRRYSLQALAGVMAEDDDDGAAANAGTPKETAKKAPGPTNGNSTPLITREEVIGVHSAAKAAGVTTVEGLAETLLNICGVAKATQIPKAELANVLEAFQSMADAREPA